MTIQSKGEEKTIRGKGGEPFSFLMNVSRLDKWKKKKLIPKKERWSVGGGGGETH